MWSDPLFHDFRRSRQRICASHSGNTCKCIARFVNRYLFLFLIALMVSCSKSDVQIAKSLNKEIAIYPDYKDVTIPVNIAPLNFSIADSSEHCLIIKGEKTQLQVYSDEGLFEIPQKRWKALLKENAGNQIELTIAQTHTGRMERLYAFSYGHRK